jgi:glycosyltransferase involved in cell wall biosynthesis
MLATRWAGLQRTGLTCHGIEGCRMIERQDMEQARPGKRRKVVFTTLILAHYRRDFHELARKGLAERSIDYELLYSPPFGHEKAKGDAIDLPWATRVPSKSFLSGKAVFQNILPHLAGADLVVLCQENRFLINYLLQLLPRSLRPALAFWGHGRNFQARDPNSRQERWKTFWTTRIDWWFGYTDETRRHVEGLGFPPERVTVFNNAVDVSGVLAARKGIDEARLAQLRAELGLTGRHVGIFVGGLYADKRLRYLVDAADLVRGLVPDFELLIVGGGVDLPLVQDLARSRPWMHVLGPRFGVEKVELMLLAQMFLMPGLVGLAILDAGACGLPMITTSFPWHSPEIAYLEHGSNGVVVQDWENPEAYAQAVAELFGDPVVLAAMSARAEEASAVYTIEGMAARFVDGVVNALEAGHAR